MPSRMDAVQAPIIPIVGELIRTNPGTISLGQGMVSWGPPPEADRGGARGGGPDGVAPVRSGRGQPGARRGARAEAARGERARSRRQPDPRDGGQQHGVPVGRPGDHVHRATRSSCPSPFYFNHEMAVRIAGLRAGDRADGRAVSDRSRRARARRHAAHARHRHGLAQQPDGRRLSRRRRCARSTSCARGAGCCTSPTRRTSTSPGTAPRTSRPARCRAPARTRSRCTRCRRPTASRDGASATW